MKHSDYDQRYKALEEQERLELANAVKAHGNEYVFVDCDSDDAEEKWNAREDYDDIPIIQGAPKYWDGNDSYYVSRITIDGGVKIYGFRTECSGPGDEVHITDIAFGYISSIIDFIPATDEISDVSIYK